MLSQKPKESLCPQFQKLIQLDSLGLFSNDFIMGYIGGQLPAPINKYEWRTLSDKLEKMKKMVVDKVITVHHVIEIILVSLAVTEKNFSASTQNLMRGLELGIFLSLTVITYLLVHSTSHISSFKSGCGFATAGLKGLVG